MGQPAQLPPQEPQEPPQMCLPAFLSRTSLRMIRPTMTKRTARTTMVAIFTCIQVSMCISSFRVIDMVYTFCVSLVLSLKGLNSCQSSPASRASATISPKTFTPPAKILPIW